MTIALQLDSVTKIYAGASGSIRAVDAVSTAIEAGEFVALVGPSGSGKTTMLALLAGLLRPDAGEIVIQNQDMNRMTDAQRTAFRRRNIGFTFQANNLVSYLTVLENVVLMLELNGSLNASGKDIAR